MHYSTLEVDATEQMWEGSKAQTTEMPSSNCRRVENGWHFRSRLATKNGKIRNSQVEGSCASARDSSNTLMVRITLLWATSYSVQDPASPIMTCGYILDLMTCMRLSKVPAYYD